MNASTELKMLTCVISAHSSFRLTLKISCHFSTGSEKEREVYQKAGRRVTEPASYREEPGKLQLSIKHAKPVFGTDFDVTVEVWTVCMNGWMDMDI